MIIIVGISAAGALMVIPALILLTQIQSAYSSKLPTVIALLLWVCLSIILAGFWFIVAVAAHKVDTVLTAAWIIANLTYPVVGTGIVLVHRRLLKRLVSNETVTS